MNQTEKYKDKQRLITFFAEGSKHINFDVKQKAPVNDLKNFVLQNIS